MIDCEHWRARLNTQLSALLDHTDTGDASATVELDQSRVGRLSRMDALLGQAMSQATDQRRRETIRRTRAAIQRLDDGTFGDCVECDEPIAIARLEIDLSAERCIDCASKRERD